MRVCLLSLVALFACACGNKQSHAPSSAPPPTSADFARGEYFNDSTDQEDSAFYYFNNATETAKDSLTIAMAYAYMAMIQHQAGDYYGTQESALAGIRIADEKNPLHTYCLASLYNVMGRSNLGLKDFDGAIRYFNLGLKLQPYEGYRNAVRNNIAVTLREKGDYAGALRVLLSIDAQPGETNSDVARRITNVASLKWKADSSFSPVADLHHALALRIDAKDEFGIAASYNHLSDYYRTKNPDSALIYASRMYTLSNRVNSIEDEVDALRKLTSLSPNNESRKYFERYEHLTDSIQTARSAARNQFAVIRYESEKSKAENLLLQEDNAQKKLEIFRQRIVSVAIFLLATIAIILFVARYRKKKKQDELRSQALIKENQLKLSQKVHDTVANGLYRIMSEMEHHEVIDKEKLLDRIEDMYERSRDISYDAIDQPSDPDERISKTLTSFATENIKVSVVGNQKELWQDVPLGIVKELEQVVQELAVNMKKHSGARHVVFHFSKSNQRLHLHYKDDGTGFRTNFEKGNGLRSTENRILEIGGETIFTSGTAGGAEIKIIVPTILK